MLTELVAALGRADSPFADEVPRVDSQGTRWLEPVLVVDIDTHGRGYERLRQPSFQGVRTDLDPEDLCEAPDRPGAGALGDVVPGGGAGRRRTRPGPPRRRGRPAARGHPPGRHRQPHQRLPRPGDPVGPQRRPLAAAAADGRRPDRVRRPGDRHPTQAEHRHHPTRHLRAAVGVRHAPRATRPGSCPTARSAAATSGCRTTGRRTTTATATRSQGGFRWWLESSNPDASERLGEYRTQYEWSIVIGFNEDQVRHRGSGIFLHVNGSGATAGCVSAPRGFIRSLMARLDPRWRPVIAIGR